MSTPEGNLGAGANAASDAVASMSTGLPGEDMSWLTELGINDPIVPGMAPLPADAGQAGAEEKPAEAAAEALTKTVEGPKPADAATKAAAPADAGLETKPADVAAADAVKADASVDPDLSPLEEKFIEQLPEAEQPGARSRMKGHTFMDFFLSPDKPKEDVRAHLAERSPSNYAEFETAVVAHNLAKPAEFCQNLYARDPQTYSKLATEVYNGNPEFFAKKLTGRDNVDPQTLQTALDFYEQNKDRIADDEPISALDDETTGELNTYFPDKAPVIIAKLAAAEAALAENKQLKATAAKSDEKAVDPKVAEANAQMEAAKVETELWDVGRDEVGDYIEKRAFDPTSGAGIFVSPEERESAPMVALVKDLKADVLFFGLNVHGKQVLPSFQQGFTEWGKERPQFQDFLARMTRFTAANEKDNVVDTAKGTFPLAQTYYEDRLRHPIFKQLDDVLALLAGQGGNKVKLDPIIPGSLPSGGGAKQGAGAAANAHSDDYLIQDALARSPK